MNIFHFSRWLMLFCLIGLIFSIAHDGVRSQNTHQSEEAMLREKISRCPYAQGIFKDEEKWLFSEEDDWLYANLVKGTKTFVFGYQKPKQKDWGEYLPRWYFTVGSMELGMVIASFKGAIKDEEYLINSISAISKNCPFPDIQASLDHKGIIEQISVDPNCDHFFDKIYNVKIRSESDFNKQEPYAQEAKIILDYLNRLRTGNW